ncbi:HigA family addiction module antitoxin [Sphingomonas crocodyli]|uniref:HigA family addiction module antitoxin n=1 Tax=Sphingomonas crocodyli TaxID=1979270 RepID=UPI001F0CD3AD|nr:HigA family addiction module antitoxin [Sphingomonas crocodyli]
MSAAFTPAPPAPSEVIRRHFLMLDGVTQQGLADALDVSRLTVSELLNNKRTITPVMALRLARVLGTDADFWLNLQMAWDLHTAEREHGKAIAMLTPLRRAPSRDEVVRSLSELGSARPDGGTVPVR